MGNCLGSPKAADSIAHHTTSSLITPSSPAGSKGSTLDQDEKRAAANGEVLESANLKIYSYAEMRSATRNFRPDSILGRGGFGTVFKGWVDENTLQPSKPGFGISVAIKKLNPDSDQGYGEWLCEVNFLGRISHPNVVKLLGYCLEDQELLLVYEFMPKGSLENHLFRRTLEPLSWAIRLIIAIGAARALAFLHTLPRKVIFRDFKASNILLDGDYNAKISDFGLAKLGPSDGDSHITTRIIGTHGYVAPEYVATGHLYVESDMYGFGVVLLEILTGRRAFDSQRPTGEENLVKWARPMLARRKKLESIMDSRMTGQYHSKAALQGSELALSCLDEEPKQRPSMKHVVEVLCQIEAM